MVPQLSLVVPQLSLGQARGNWSEEHGSVFLVWSTGSYKKRLPAQSVAIWIVTTDESEAWDSGLTPAD